MSVLAQSAAPGTETHRVADFLLTQTATGLQVTHKDAPDQVIWDTVTNGTFLVAEIATADIREFGTPEGSFEITDTVSSSFGQPTIEAIAVDGKAAVVTGKLTGASGAIGYKLAFEAVSTSHLRFTITVDAADVNRIRLHDDR